MSDTERLQHMSSREMALLGVQDIAYVKHVIVDDVAAYAVHAADGTQIAVLPDRDVAFATVRLHDLEPLSVH